MTINTYLADKLFIRLAIPIKVQNLFTYISDEIDFRYEAIKLCHELMRIKGLPESIKDDKTGIPYLIKSKIPNLSNMQLFELCNELNTIIVHLNNLKVENKLADLADDIDSYTDFARCNGGIKNNISDFIRFLEGAKMRELYGIGGMIQNAKEKVINQKLGEIQKNHGISRGYEIHADYVVKSLLANSYGINVPWYKNISRFLTEVGMLNAFYPRVQEVYNDVNAYVKDVEFARDLISALGGELALKLDGPIKVMKGDAQSYLQDIGIQTCDLYKNEQYDSLNVNIEHLKRLYFVQKLTKEGYYTQQQDTFRNHLANPSVALLIAKIGRDFYDDNDKLIAPAVRIKDDFITINELEDYLRASRDFQLRLKNDPEVQTLYNQVQAEKKMSAFRILEMTPYQCKRLAYTIAEYERNTESKNRHYNDFSQFTNNKEISKIMMNIAQDVQRIHKKNGVTLAINECFYSVVDFFRSIFGMKTLENEFTKSFLYTDKGQQESFVNLINTKPKSSFAMNK